MGAQHWTVSALKIPRTPRPSRGWLLCRAPTRGWVVLRGAMRFTPLLLLITCGAAQAAPSDPQWTLQVDPLTAALGFAHVQVERALTPRVSLYVGPHLRLFDSLLDDKSEPFRGYGVEAGLRWFWNPTAPAGLWAQVRGVAARLSTHDGDEAALGGYGSALVGWTGIFLDRWVLAGGAGAQYLHYRVADYGPRGVFPALHTTIGIAF